MELRHLDTLLAIAEQGSFTAAADVLSTVQSNVSEQVRQLVQCGSTMYAVVRKPGTPTRLPVSDPSVRSCGATTTGP